MAKRWLWSSFFMFVVLSGCAPGNDEGESPLGRGSLTSQTTRSQHIPAPSTATSATTGLRVAIPSHCGVISVTVKGRLWLADPPLGHHNPPAGWDENQTLGYFVFTSPKRAEFHGDGGQTAQFRLATAGTHDPGAGCE